VLAPEVEVGSLAASLKDVLAAESVKEAQDLLDDLGYAPLDSQEVTGVPGGGSVVLGGSNASPSDNDGPATDVPTTDAGASASPFGSPAGAATGGSPTSQSPRDGGGTAPDSKT